MRHAATTSDRPLEYGLPETARRVVGRRSTQETRVHNALDDMAGNVDRAWQILLAMSQDAM